MANLKAGGQTNRKKVQVRIFYVVFTVFTKLCVKFVGIYGHL